MILGQIWYIDCLVFLLFLFPQLLLNVSPFVLIYHGLWTLPFLIFVLPYQFVKERYFTARLRRSPFVQRATPFQDFVIRCVRYAFANLPAKIGRVFFSKGVALPFLRFRMLRHGYFQSPMSWREVNENGVRGLWITQNEDLKPDLIIYYLHGGGFSMGSAYFYLEFLLAYVTLLRPYYRNPCAFALEYTLVPDATYPTQLTETIAGYKYILSRISGSPKKAASRICFGGDSAGATLLLSLLLHIADQGSLKLPPPAYATLISPWPTLTTHLHKPTSSDFISPSSLHLYASQYASTASNPSSQTLSPGICTSYSLWARASPLEGMIVAYGADEVLAPDIVALIRVLRESAVSVSVREEAGGIHAWVVASLFLGQREEDRTKGLNDLVWGISRNIPHTTFSLAGRVNGAR